MASNEIDPTLLEGGDAMKYLELYQKEWEVTIKTQMHFNDLIVRYRQIFLTLFLTLITVTITLYINQRIGEKTFYCVLAAILVSWCLAFLLDYFYYHQMLLGSVEQARKFDDNPKLKKWGLFGLTREISNRVSSRKASIVIAMFYGLPTGLSILGAFIVGRYR